MTLPKKKKESVVVPLDKVRFLEDGDLRKALLDAKPDEVFLIGQNITEHLPTVAPGESVEGKQMDKQVELVWAKVFRTKG